MSDNQSRQLESQLATIRDRLDAGIDRREFVRTLVSGGYAVGMAQLLGVDDVLSADDDEVPIVTALARTDPDDPWSLTERTRTVPADWVVAVETAIELNELLARFGFTGYLGSAVVPGSYDSGTATVSVGVSSDAESIESVIDDLRDGVSVDVETIVNIEDAGDEFDSLEPRYLTTAEEAIPSGVACETPSSLATLGPALYQPADRRTFFVTAEHAFTGTPDGDAVTLPVVDAESVNLGTVEHAHRVEDIAAVEPQGEVVPSNTIDTPSPSRVRGQFTRWGLADLIARDEQLEKVGALTGHTSGKIQGFDAVTCFTDDFCRRGQIRWGGEMDLTDGDSGSVSFHPDPGGEDGDVLVAGFNNARTWWPGQSYVWGIAAYMLTDAYGYHF